MKRWAILFVKGMNSSVPERVFRILNSQGIDCTKISLKDLSNGVLKVEDFRGLIYAHGEKFPIEAYMPLYNYHKSGGAICWLEGVPFRRPVAHDVSGNWTINYDSQINGVPSWFYYLSEDKGDCTWSCLVEQWGLAFEPLANADYIEDVVSNMKNFDLSYKEKDIKVFEGCIQPIENGMEFYSIADAKLNTAVKLGSLAYVAQHRANQFKGARIGGLLPLLPKGKSGDQIIVKLVNAMTSTLKGKKVKSIGLKKPDTSKYPNGFTNASIKKVSEKGVQILIDGKPIYPAMYEFEVTSRALRKSIPNLYKAGVKIFKPTFDIFPTWIGLDKYDYTLFDKVVELILAVAPEGFVWPHIAVIPPLWWWEIHSDQLKVNDVKSNRPFCNSNKLFYCSSNADCPSLSSTIWKRDICQVFSQLINHIKNSWYASRFLGIHLGYGFATECSEPAFVADRWYFGDFSERARKEFEVFAQNEHPKWKNKYVHVPKRHERYVCDSGTFLDPSCGHLISLWSEFLNRKIVSTLDEFAGQIKRDSNGSILVSAFNGYFFQAGRCAYLHADNNIRLSPLLDAKNIDAFETPYGYDQRKLDGDCTYRGVPNVLINHGKLYISQNDQRTHFSTSSCDGWLRPESDNESIETLKRDMAMALTRGAAQSWFDFGRGWYDDPKYLKTLKQLLKLGEKSLDWKSEDLDGMGVVIDDEMLSNQRMANTLLYRLMYEQKNKFFNRIGVAWNVYLLKDLLSGNIKPPHKTWLFLNTFLVSHQQRKQIRKLFCCNNQTLVWMYAPGFQSPQGLSVDTISELTDMKTKMLKTAASGQISLTNFNDPITDNIKEQSIYARFGAKDIDDKNSILDPVFYIDDTAATVLGQLEAVNLPGFAVKRFSDYTSIYATTSQLNEVIYRNICRNAGTHIYSDSGDVLYIHPNLITLITQKIGKKIIRLPRAKCVKDALSGKIILELGKEIEVNVSVGKTCVFELS